MCTFFLFDESEMVMGAVAFEFNKVWCEFNLKVITTEMIYEIWFFKNFALFMWIIQDTVNIYILNWNYPWKLYRTKNIKNMLFKQNQYKIIFYVGYISVYRKLYCNGIVMQHIAFLL